MDTSTIVRIGLIALVLIAVAIAMLSLPRSRSRTAMRAPHRQAVRRGAATGASRSYVTTDFSGTDSGGSGGGCSYDSGGGFGGGDGGGGSC